MLNVNLCSIPYLSIDYSNVVDFENKQSMLNFFKKQTRQTVETNLKHDNERTYVVVNLDFSTCNQYDYLWYTDDNGKQWYYFITNVTYETISKTRLNLSLDVWTSYQFQFKLLPSFVDRCHVDRWNGDIPTYNMEDEGIDIGEYIQIEEPQVITKMNKSIIITSSVPIGLVDNPYPSGGGDGDCWESGKLSPQGFRFIKGFEGFAPNPYQDSGGYWTIAYGVTKHGEPPIYNNLVANAPVSEAEGAKISYDLKNKNYGLKIVDSVKGLGVTKQHQFDALLSVAYNCGVGAINGSNSLTEAIARNITDETTIRSVWENFRVTSNGIHLPGLVARRKQECNMFFNKEFETRSIGLIGSNGTVVGTVTENNGDGWLPSGCTPSEGESVDGYKIFNNDFGNGWLCPVKGGTVTSKYGWRIHPISGEKKFHHGTDIGIATGKPTVASKDGIVSQCGYHASMGNYIYIDSGEYRTKYMHLSKIQVELGQQVKQGEIVGLIGSTGASTGAHSHWEIRNISTNESCDPAPSLNKGDKI